MDKLNLPEFDFRITNDKNKLKIFDEIRKKYIALTPEEWVRQNFLKWLCVEKKYPASLISVESGLKYHRLNKRSDAVIYDRQGKPVIIIEFKAPNIELDNDTLSQVLCYNYSVNAPYLIITNGLQHYCIKIDVENKKCSFLDEIPDYESLMQNTDI